MLLGIDPIHTAWQQREHVLGHTLRVHWYIIQLNMFHCVLVDTWQMIFPLDPIWWKHIYAAMYCTIHWTAPYAKPIPQYVSCGGRMFDRDRLLDVLDVLYNMCMYFECTWCIVQYTWVHLMCKLISFLIHSMCYVLGQYIMEHAYLAVFGVVLRRLVFNPVWIPCGAFLLSWDELMNWCIFLIQILEYCNVRRYIVQYMPLKGRERHSMNWGVCPQCGFASDMRFAICLTHPHKMQVHIWTIFS